jgi:hypothetical protein
MAKLRSRLSYANVMATVAVFIALGGGAYAAIKLPANSVGTKQLKHDAVVSSKVKNGSLTGQDFAAGTVLKGDKGAPCPSSDPACRGPKGDPCPSSDLACRGAKGDPGTPADTSSFYTKSEVRSRFARGAANTVQSNQSPNPTLILQYGPLSLNLLCTVVSTSLHAKVFASVSNSYTAVFTSSGTGTNLAPGTDHLFIDVSVPTMNDPAASGGFPYSLATVDQASNYYMAGHAYAKVRGTGCEAGAYRISSFQSTENAGDGPP